MSKMVSEVTVKFELYDKMGAYSSDPLEAAEEILLKLKSYTKDEFEELVAAAVCVCRPEIDSDGGIGVIVRFRETEPELKLN